MIIEIVVTFNFYVLKCLFNLEFGFIYFNSNFDLNFDFSSNFN
jgi:hypothetical protein